MTKHWCVQQECTQKPGICLSTLPIFFTIKFSFPDPRVNIVIGGIINMILFKFLVSVLTKGQGIDHGHPCKQDSRSCSKSDVMQLQH